MKVEQTEQVAQKLSYLLSFHNIIRELTTSTVRTSKKNNHTNLPQTITFDVIGPRPETMSCSIHRVAEGKETSNRCGYHIQSLVTKNYPVFKASFHNMKLEQTQGHELEYYTSDCSTSYVRRLHVW